MKIFRHKTRWYWVAQLALWSAFWLVLLSNYVALHSPLPGEDELARVAAWLGAQAGAGLLLTHLVRLGLVRSGVLSAGLGRQVLVLIGLKIGLAYVYQPLLRGLQHLVPPPAERVDLVAQPKLASADRGKAADQADFEEGVRWGMTATGRGQAAGQAVRLSLDRLLGQSAWAHYTFVWLLGYLLVVLAERRLGAEVAKARAEAALSRTQLELLHQQINPHFLFNTLNSIRALALTDPTRTRTALTQLADLLRYSLRPPGAGTALIPLREELAAVQDYLALEQTRFGPERLQIHLDVPAEVLNWPVPPAALLTLVENAVKHGISASPTGGRLAVTGTTAGADLLLTVSQPGHLATQPSGSSGGLGLRNTHQRLRALYGEAAQLSLTEAPPGTVMARLQIPATSKEALAAASSHQ